MWHANGYECGSITLEPHCTSKEYGNPFSIMGLSNWGLHPTAFAKEWIGWLSEDQILTATHTGRYVIYPLETAGSNAKAVRIPLKNPLRVRTLHETTPVAATEYYLEFRRPIGLDAPDPIEQSNVVIDFDGVLLYTWAIRPNSFVRFTEHKEEVVTLLLDTTPGSIADPAFTNLPDDFSDAVLKLGARFRDEENGITIEPLHIREDGGIEILITVE